MRTYGSIIGMGLDRKDVVNRITPNLFPIILLYNDASKANIGSDDNVETNC